MTVSRLSVGGSNAIELGPMNVGLEIVTPTSIANSGGSASLAGGQVTFTGVTTISLDGVFTATYQNYRVLINFTGSASETLQMRLRVGGADLSTSYYGSTVTAGNSTTALANANTTNGTSLEIGYSPTSLSATAIDVMDPVVTAKTIIYGFGINSATVGNLRIVGGFNNNSTSYTGMTIFPVSGTITGTIRVYGYKNS